MSAEKPLDGKVAIVTGAGGGIGRAVAMAYAAAGAQVVVASRTPATVTAVTEEIKRAGGEALGVPCDVGVRDQVFSMVETAVAEFKAVHILVNNAQGFGSAKNSTHTVIAKPFEDTDEDEWEYTFRTGATATLWCMKAAFPHLKKAGYGRVINFGSSAGQVGIEGMAAYNMTKEAIRTLTRTAAREWGRYGITVNTLVPLLETRAAKSWQEIRPDQFAEMIQRLPMRRFGTPEKDLAPLAVFIAGEGSGYMTGMTFMVEGGNLMFP